MVVAVSIGDYCNGLSITGVINNLTNDIVLCKRRRVTIMLFQ